MVCQKGKIKRSAYTRKNGTHVSATCVPDKGKPGKTPQNQKILPPIKDKGYLTSCGYSTKKTSRSRHMALNKAAHSAAVKNASSLKAGYTTVERHLNLIRNYTPKNTMTHKIMSSDIEYLKSKRKNVKT